MDTDDKIRHWLKSGRQLLQEVSKVSPETQREILALLEAFSGKEDRSPPRLYLIANEGIHPIVEDLKQQFGEAIEYEVVTRGNVELGEEATVAKRVKEILEKHHGKEIVIVPSGLPYLITVVYNTVLQITSKHPVYLQLDRENGRYVEKVLDPRKLML